MIRRQIPVILSNNFDRLVGNATIHIEHGSASIVIQTDSEIAELLSTKLVEISITYIEGVNDGKSSSKEE